MHRVGDRRIFMDLASFFGAWQCLGRILPAKAVFLVLIASLIARLGRRACSTVYRIRGHHNCPCLAPKHRVDLVLGRWPRELTQRLCFVDIQIRVHVIHVYKVHVHVIIRPNQPSSRDFPCVGEAFEKIRAIGRRGQVEVNIKTHNSKSTRQSRQ